MKLTSRMVAVLCGAVLLGGLALVTAHAQNLANQKTYFTFSHAVVLPNGVRLEPGRYTFRLADSMSDRNIVQVLNEDESKMLAMFMTITAPNRLEPSEESVITFAEASPTEPQPVRYWYYPGQYTGHEFVYRKAEAERIAKITHTRVLATEDAVTNKEELQHAEILTVEPSGETAAYESEPATSTAAQSSVQTEQKVSQNDQRRQVSEETQVSQQADVSQQSDVSQQNTRRAESAVDTQTSSSTVGTAGQTASSEGRERSVARNELPRTATFDPVMGLMGLMSLGGFIALRRRVR